MTTTYRSDERTDRQTDAVLLFDMDGVILEGWGTDSEVHSHALDDVLSTRDIDINGDLRAALDSYEYTDEFRAACEELGVDPVEFYHAREARSEKRAIERLADGSRGLCSDTDALEQLAERIPLGIVSNNYDQTVEFVVDHFGLESFQFTRGRDIGAEGFDQRKPDPHYLNEALDALDAAGGLYVGDRASDVIAAERAGLDSVFIRREHNASLELDVEPTVEIESLTELVSLVDQR